MQCNYRRQLTGTRWTATVMINAFHYYKYVCETHTHRYCHLKLRCSRSKQSTECRRQTTRPMQLSNFWLQTRQSTLCLTYFKHSRLSSRKPNVSKWFIYILFNFFLITHHHHLLAAMSCLTVHYRVGLLIKTKRNLFTAFGYVVKSYDRQ